MVVLEWLKEGATSKHLIRHNRPVTQDLHPLVYGAVIGMTLWFVLVAWDFFDDGETGLLLAVVSIFFFIAVAIPLVLARVWRKCRSSDADRAEETSSLREWMSSNFQTWQGRLKGADAAILVLLPFAAVALGMTAFAIVLHVVAHGAHS